MNGLKAAGHSCSAASANYRNSRQTAHFFTGQSRSLRHTVCLCHDCIQLRLLLHKKFLEFVFCAVLCPLCRYGLHNLQVLFPLENGFIQPLLALPGRR